jgi:hypothetical protein
VTLTDGAARAAGTRRAPRSTRSYRMDEKDFKKHLADLVHGHHHPEQHDWSLDSAVRTSKKESGASASKTAKRTARKPRRRAK